VQHHAARSLQLTSSSLLPAGSRRAYLTGEPAADARFVFAHPLEHLGGYTRPRKQSGVAATMLPEIMPYNPARPARPWLGRVAETTSEPPCAPMAVPVCRRHLRMIS
jgi:hypothetical protein